MGLLVPVFSPLGIRDTLMAAQLYAGLETRQIRLEEWRIHSTEELASLQNILSDCTACTISFNDARLDSIATCELVNLIKKDFSYLDLGATNCGLRIWPTKVWLHFTWRSGEELAAFARDLSGEAGRTIPLTGTSTIQESEFTITTTAADSLGLTLETTARDLALRLFLKSCLESRCSGFIADPQDSAREPLMAFLRSSTAKVSAELTLSTAAALRNAEKLRGALQWQAEGTLISMPSGRVFTYLLAPVDVNKAVAWREEIAAVLTLIDKR